MKQNSNRNRIINMVKQAKRDGMDHNFITDRVKNKEFALELVNIWQSLDPTKEFLGAKYSKTF